MQNSPLRTDSVCFSVYCANPKGRQTMVSFFSFEHKSWRKWWRFQLFKHYAPEVLRLLTHEKKFSKILLLFHFSHSPSRALSRDCRWSRRIWAIVAKLQLFFHFVRLLCALYREMQMVTKKIIFFLFIRFLLLIYFCFVLFSNFFPFQRVLQIIWISIYYRSASELDRKVSHVPQCYAQYVLNLTLTEAVWKLVWR